MITSKNSFFSKISFLVFFLGITISLTYAQSVLVETELFDDKGGWTVDAQFIDQMGSPYLLAHGLGTPVEDAVTQVQFPEKGKYYVWVRTKDWAPFPKGPGKFKIAINGTPLDHVFGAEGTVGWQWSSGGRVDIDNTDVEIRLTDLTGFEGRCDAIFFTKSKKEKLPADLVSLENFRKTHLPFTGKMHEAGDFDLVVVGGGVAGICAAIEAARRDLKVALINNREVLGGNSSSEIRIPTEGDIFRNQYKSIGRIVREIDNSLAGIGNPDGKMYNDDWRRKVVLNEDNITLFENVHVNKVEKKGTRITAVVGVNVKTLEKHRITGTLFSDCTGDATLGILAGAEHTYGRESKSQTGENDAPDVVDSLTMGTSNQWYAIPINAGSEFPVQEWMLQFSDAYHFDITRSVWNWETGFGNFHIVDQAEEIRDHNFRAIYGNWAYLKTYKPEKYGNHKLAYLSYVAGKRESYRLIGDFILKQQDIDEKIVYPDAIVTSTWGIDLHYPDETNSRYFPGQEFIGYAIHPDKENNVYTFPYRCLYSRNIENLFMAGRNISVTHIALGAVRVQRCTGMMGEVVGIAASLCKKNNCNPRDIYQTYLNELLEIVR